MRRVTIILSEHGATAHSELDMADIEADHTAAAALGVWVYRNRHVLGLELELVHGNQRVIAP